MHWEEIGRMTVAEMLVHENEEIRKLANEIIRVLLKEKQQTRVPSGHPK